jgi:hypothetical protein
MRSAVLVSLGLLVSLAWACGKRGDPSPPLPRGPAAVHDLSAEQEGADAVLIFSYPDRLLTGLPLTDLEAVEIYRVVNPPPTLTTRPAATQSSNAPRTDEAPAAGARRAALNARLAEEAFYKEAKRVDSLTLPALAHRTLGAKIVYRDPLLPLFAEGHAPSSLGYAVVSVRRGGQRSPLSNIALVSPDIPPGPPTILAVTAEEGRICLEWLDPQADLLNRQPAKIGGYFVYRRAIDEEEYGPPLNKKQIPGTAFVDLTPPYGKLVYTVRATLPGKSNTLGAPAAEAGIDYRDVFAPPAPGRLDALSEGRLVRLVWDPVAASDLAGYAIFRTEGAGAPERLNQDLVKESFFNDETVQAGRRYRYTVKAIDTAGNASAPSPEAVAEPF